MQSLKRTLSRLSKEHGVRKPKLLTLSRDEYFGEPPEGDAYYRYAKGRSLVPGERFTGSYRGTGAEIHADGPTIMLFAPQGDDVDTLGHEFAHYLEWLDNRDTYDEHGERRVEPYESTVGDTLSRLGL